MLDKKAIGILLDKADADWFKAKADLSKADADLIKARVDWDQANDYLDKAKVITKFLK